MDNWMDGTVDGCMDGLNGEMDGGIGWLDRCTDKWTYECMDEWKDGSGGQSTQIKYLSKSTDTYSKILLQ